MARVIQGTQVRLPFATLDVTGTLFDATTITAVLLAPDGAKTNYSLAGSTITRTAVGTYYLVTPSNLVTTSGATEYTLAVTALIGGFTTVDLVSYAVDPDPTL